MYISQEFCCGYSELPAVQATCSRFVHLQIAKQPSAAKEVIRPHSDVVLLIPCCLVYSRHNISRSPLSARDELAHSLQGNISIKIFCQVRGKMSRSEREQIDLLKGFSACDVGVWSNSRSESVLTTQSRYQMPCSNLRNRKPDKQQRLAI